MSPVPRIAIAERRATHPGNSDTGPVFLAVPEILGLLDARLKIGVVGQTDRLVFWATCFATCNWQAKIGKFMPQIRRLQV